MTAPAAQPTPGAVGFIPCGSFTTDGGAWLGDPVMRCDLGMEQLADLLALKLAGRDVPEPFAALSPRGVLSDLMLVAQNEVARQRQRAEYAESTGAEARAIAARLWRLVFDAGKRKTVRTADVRAALEGFLMPADPENSGVEHRMVAGSHERPRGAECICGGAWDRWNEQCVNQKGVTRRG